MKQVEVKICGLTNREDAAAAADLGADYAGFVLYAGSPRGLAAARLVRIAESLPAGIRLVGVFVNESRSTVETTARDAGLFAVQLHGDESAAEFDGFPFPVWRAVRMRDGVPVPRPDEWAAERYVVDSAVPGKYGGTGALADWKAAERLAARHAVMLAGGLTPGNVGEAVAAVRPLGVDVSTGVESSPGRKDLRKVELFIRAARAGSTEK